MTNRLAEALMRNRRLRMIKELKEHGVEVELNDFLSIDESMALVIETRDFMDKHEPQVDVLSYEEALICIPINISILEPYEKGKGILLHRFLCETGAIRLKTGDIIANIDFFIGFTGFGDREYDFEFVGTDFNYGTLVERNEYNILMLYWG